MEVELPVGWELRKFADIVAENKKSQLKVSDAANCGPYKFYTSGESILQHDKFLVESENIFLATGGVANVKYDIEKVAYSTDTYSLKIKDNSSAKLLYYHILNDLWYINYNYFEGSGLKHLQKKDLRKHTFSYPENIEEQQKIAQILTRMDDAIANTQVMIDKYEDIKKGLMQDLLTKGIDENGNIRSEETHQFKDSPLGRIPAEWEPQKLGDFILAIDPQPDHRTPQEVENGIPYIGISDVTKKGEIDFVKARTVGVNVLLKQNKAFQIEKGDIIFGKIGTIGKPTLLPNFNNCRYTLSANVILIKPKINSDFIYFTLLSHYIENQIFLSIHSTSQPAFGMKKIRDLKILLPSINSGEIEAITKILNKILSKISYLESDLEKKRSQKIALMQDLLSGKVKVTV